MDTNQLLDADFQNTGLNLTSDIRTNLSETARWGKFISIVGFVFVGLFAIFAIFAGAIFSSALNEMADVYPFQISGVFISLFYLGFALLYFFPCLYLYRFSTRMQTALAADSGGDLSVAFKNLKSVYRFMGIFMAIILGFYALMFVFGIFGGLMTAFS